ncbi:MAG: hypothetical protein BAJATHORv1_10607 [Candidatus Thorarchaeota archaeon]|nr:MAG: hypothetical protein BAJATHORv1_10607 [Candidatus Thorarchaeota archaeon]
MDTVSLIKTDEKLKRSIEAGLDLIGGFGGLRSPVLIKPNICTISDGTGYSVSDIKLIEALVQVLFEWDSSLSIRIVESDSQSKYADKAFEKFGYTELVEKINDKGQDLKLVNLSKSELVETNFEGRYFKHAKLPKELVEPHYFITVPVAKTHYLTWITGALKNQFGLLPEKNQASFHKKIIEIVIDFNRLVQPELCIIDARIGVEGWNGPKTHEIGVLILGHRPVSVDSVMAQLMCFEPEKIEHLVESSKHNLGSLSPEIVGESLESVKIEFSSPH